MRHGETGGTEERYIREIDPKQEDPAVRAVADIVAGLFPNSRIEKIKRKRDNKTEETGELLAFFGGEPAIVTDATSELKENARERKRQKLIEQPFVNTSYSEHDLPRALIYLDPVEAAQYLLDQDLEVHPGLREQVLQGYKNSLTYDLGATKHKLEQERLKAWLDMIEAKMKEIKTKKSGKPTMPMH